jgi:hypothetical protein
MIKRFLIFAAIAMLVVLPSTVQAKEGVGPPDGMFYAGDMLFKTVVTPTAIPDKGKFDTLYMFPDCNDCKPVSDAAPGVGQYNGGRWKVVLAHGITQQYTNAADVITNATSEEDTGIRFVCPLIKKMDK